MDCELIAFLIIAGTIELCLISFLIWSEGFKLKTLSMFVLIHLIPILINSLLYGLFAGLMYLLGC